MWGHLTKLSDQQHYEPKHSSRSPKEQLKKSANELQRPKVQTSSCSPGWTLSDWRSPTQFLVLSYCVSSRMVCGSPAVSRALSCSLCQTFSYSSAFLVLMVPAINVVFFVDVSFKGLHAATLVDELCSYYWCLSLEKETEISVKLHVHINNITLM